MVKHTQTIRRQKPTKCLNVFDHFVGLALKGLMLVLLSDGVPRSLAETETLRDITFSLSNVRLVVMRPVPCKK